MGAHRFLLVAVLAVLVAAAPAPVAVALEPACAPEPVGCGVSVETNEPCGSDVEVDGRTCVHHSRVRVAPPGPARVALVADEEDAAGHVNLTDTGNAWTTLRVRVELTAGDQQVAGAGAEALVSNQTAGPQSTRQVFLLADAGAGGAPAAVGLALLLYDGMPRWCTVVTPVGSNTLDCSGDDARYLLP